MSEPSSPRKDLVIVPEAVAADGQLFTGRRPQSAFWRARTLELQLAALHVAKLDGVRAALGELQFPDALSVETKWNPSDAALMDRSSSALEKIADFADRAQRDGCGTLTTISDQAFVIVAKLTTLAAYLMDREQVTPDTVKELLRKYRELIAEIEHRLAQAGLQEAVMILQAVTDIDSLDRFDSREEFFAELNHRAALLLGLKCLVATHLREGEAPGEWPPDEDSTPPIQVTKTGRK